LLSCSTMLKRAKVKSWEDRPRRASVKIVSVLMSAAFLGSYKMEGRVYGLLRGSESVLAKDLIASNCEAMEDAIAGVSHQNEGSTILVSVLVLLLMLFFFFSAEELKSEDCERTRCYIDLRLSRWAARRV